MCHVMCVTVCALFIVYTREIEGESVCLCVCVCLIICRVYTCMSLRVWVKVFVRNIYILFFWMLQAIDNRKLLWHGTKVAVVAAILKSGLRIMPHSGGRVGKGIYL